MEYFEIQKDEKVLWFYPAKVHNNFQINSISLEGANFERLANDSNFPDPFYYFIGFYSHSSLEDNKKKEKKPSKKLKSLSFVEYFRETRNSSLSPISTRSSNKFHKNSLFKNTVDTEEERTEIYKAIKQPQFFFDENNKLIREMNMTIMQNKNQIKRRNCPKKSAENLSKSVLFVREFHEISHKKIQEHRSPLERKFHRTFQKGFKDPLEPKPEIYLNQLSVSSIVSHRWRNEASKQRILKMTPEFAEEKYNFSNFLTHI